MKEELKICKRNDVSKYLPQIDSADADWDFCNDVSHNSETVFAIEVDGEIVGLSCIRDDIDSYIYVYIFPAYRNRGYGSLAVSASERQLSTPSPESISTAYHSASAIARNLAEKHGYIKRLSSVVYQYKGEPFVLPHLPIRKHRDEDFIDAYTLSAYMLRW